MILTIDALYGILLCSLVIRYSYTSISMVEARKQFGQMIDGQMPQSPQIRKLRRVPSEQDSDIIVPPKQDDVHIDSATPLDIGDDIETAELEAFSRKKIKKTFHDPAPTFSKKRLKEFDKYLESSFSATQKETPTPKKPQQTNTERIGAQIVDIEHHIAHTKDFMTRLDPTNDAVRIERYKKQLVALEQTKEKLMGKILENQPVHLSDFHNDTEQHSGNTPEKTPRMSSTSEREALAISHTIQFPSYENSDAKTAVYTGDIITKELMNIYRLSPDDKLTLSRDTRFPQLLDEAIKNKRQHGGITDITSDVLIPFLFDYIQSTQEEIRAEKEREHTRKKGIFERIGNIFRRATQSPLEARLATLLRLDEQILKRQSKNM